LIFLSLGTHEQPFSRAIELVEPIAQAGEEVVVQHGSTPPQAGMAGVRWLPYLDYGGMVDTMVGARGFVCHAGVGSIMTALRHAVTPVVVPREARLDEHVDDHQRQLSDRLAQLGLIVVADERGLEPALESAAALRGASRGPGVQLSMAIERASDRRGRLLPARPRWFRPAVDQDRRRTSR